MQACGNPKCSRSTGIHGGITFGSGQLDHNGYWSKPCRPCAEAFDNSLRDRMINLTVYYKGTTPDVMELHDKLLGAGEWALQKAWPYNDAN